MASFMMSCCICLAFNMFWQFCHDLFSLCTHFQLVGTARHGAPHFLQAQCSITVRVLALTKQALLWGVNLPAPAALVPDETAADKPGTVTSIPATGPQHLVRRAGYHNVLRLFREGLKVRATQQRCNEDTSAVIVFIHFHDLRAVWKVSVDQHCCKDGLNVPLCTVSGQ